ncbi:SsgA family sporulation/cell division regulator [Nonomuraea polychroma]|uniref:SsgA family sporulation/cell division regulator n=1 Tax=Nonomuraea polychroma TaxID=46176 RepID=UPI003D8D9569
MTGLVRRPVTLWDAARHGDEPYMATITFRADDPYAVELDIPRRGVTVTFARDLIIDGLAWPSGDGVVRVEPHEDDSDYLILWPTVRRDRVFYAERDAVEAFLEETCRMVPLNRQRPIARAELDRWLAEVTA